MRCRTQVHLAGLVALLATLAAVQVAEAGQGCPFDDDSCQEYCGQQGCQLGYCGHFGWIQCICRKCGDEWNLYDKVHYNPNQQVNQTELESLKLNSSAPLILTSNSEKGVAPATLAASRPALATAARTRQAAAGQQQQQVAATLTTLLIPDLSEGGKLDLNDIPDENSDKFLDYLAKNHEKLVQATASQQQQQPPASQQTRGSGAAADDDDETVAEQTDANAPQDQLATSASDEDTVEIQITSSNNDAAEQQQQQQQAASEGRVAAAARLADEQRAPSTSGALTRLLRMPFAEQLSDELET